MNILLMVNEMICWLIFYLNLIVNNIICSLYISFYVKYLKVKITNCSDHSIHKFIWEKGDVSGHLRLYINPHFKTNRYLHL